MHNKLYPQAESVIALPSLYRVYGRFPLAENGLFKSKLLISHRTRARPLPERLRSALQKGVPPPEEIASEHSLYKLQQNGDPHTTPHPSLMIYRKGSRSPSRSAPGTKGVLCLGGFSRRRFMDGLRSVSRCGKHPFF